MHNPTRCTISNTITVTAQPAPSAIGSLGFCSLAGPDGKLWHRSGLGTVLQYEGKPSRLTCTIRILEAYLTKSRQGPGKHVPPAVCKRSCKASASGLCGPVCMSVRGCRFSCTLLCPLPLVQDILVKSLTSMLSRKSSEVPSQWPLALLARNFDLRFTGGCGDACQ